jgi:putative alpha-1,2-mannosidase
MDVRYSALEEGRKSDSAPRTRQISVGPMLGRRRLQSCRRCVLFLVIAVGIIILPFGTLYTFEGIENGKGALAVERPDEQVVSGVDSDASTVSIVWPTTSATRIASPTAVPTTTTSALDRPTWILPRRNLSEYVDPLIGTEAQGHCISSPKFANLAYAGATVPFGMAKAVPDSTTAWQNQAGFLHDRSAFSGIGQMHDEGTGGTASLGNFPIWIDQCRGPLWEMCPVYMAERRGDRVGEPIAEVGSFGVELSTGFEIGELPITKANAEMTSTRRTNLFRITANDSMLTPILSVGLTDLSRSTIEAYAEVRENYRVVGNGTFRPSFGEGKYSLYFCMDVRADQAWIQDHVVVKGQDLFNNTSVRLENRIHRYDSANLVSEMQFVDDKDGAVVLRLSEMAAGESLLVRMGLSFISSEKACSNAEEEIPTFDFAAVSQSANSQFEDLLNRIRVNTTNVTEDTLILFYSSVHPKYLGLT